MTMKGLELQLSYFTRATTVKSSFVVERVRKFWVEATEKLSSPTNRVTRPRSRVPSNQRLTLQLFFLHSSSASHIILAMAQAFVS